MGKIWVGSKLKMSLDPTKRKETEKTKKVTPRSVAVKENEKKKKIQRIRINNEAIPRERNHKKKMLKNMESVKIVERVLK